VLITSAPVPTISISDLSQAEGPTGLKAFDFTVTLSAPSNQTVTVDYFPRPGTATHAVDYQASGGVVVFNPGVTSQIATVVVNGDKQDEPNETFFVQLSNSKNATLARAEALGTIINDDAPGSLSLQFSASSYSVQEDLGIATLTVNRSGDASDPASVDYATADNTAKQKSDYEIAAGTLNFAAGETSKTITILINEDALIEGDETFQVALSNPVGITLGPITNSSVTIVDDMPESAANPIDDAQTFVAMQYHDFLNREPDPAGLQFWTNEITSCGSNAECREAKRVNVSAAFFFSIESQGTGFLLYLLQKESFGSQPRYAQFMRDVQELSRGVIVGSPDWEQQLLNNQLKFADDWVKRPAFKSVYDGMSNVAFVNTIYANAGLVPPQSDKEFLVAALDSAKITRARLLLEFTVIDAFRQQEHSPAFVLIQYFGYLRRDPEASPDSDWSGYNFWLQKLNVFKGDYQQAEMVKAFLNSSEYRGRFGQ
jgi:hypothetical protein